MAQNQTAMKYLLATLILCSSISGFAQARKAPTMEPVYSDGYYVNFKGDTIKGKVQTNVSEETDMYAQFAFLPPRSKKPKLFSTNTRILAYGVDNRHFVLVSYQGEKMFVERLATGRLRFYQQKIKGKVDGKEGIETSYFIKDTQADDASLAEMKKISTKFYKKMLKRYMQDQPMIWSDLDKFTFDEKVVLKAVKEFNSYYASTAN